MLGFDGLALLNQLFFYSFFLNTVATQLHLPVFALQKLIIKSQNYTFSFTFSE
jgi:hypothetical protein